MRFSYNVDDKQKSDLSKLKVIKIAFPRFVERVPVYSKASLSADSLGIQSFLEKAEPVNEIAFASLNDRMFKEFATALIRFAFKQLAEMEARKKNDGMGAAVSIFNALTEQADTRNWQLLPFAIQYSRMTLPAGNQNLRLNIRGKDMNTDIPITTTIKAGATAFGFYQDNKFAGFRVQ